MSTRLARTVLALSLAASVSGAARAAPTGNIPLPPPPSGMTLSQTSGRQLSAAAKLGYYAPLGNGGKGAAVLEADATTPWRTTAGGVALAWALELRSFMPSKGTHGGLDAGFTGLELTPTLRAAVPLSGRTSLRTQLGVGAVARWTWTEVDQRFVGRKTVTGSEATALLRTGIALDWAVRPRLSIAIEPLSLGFDLRGNADWIFAAGATYRL